jgi:hypothetical protein
MYCVNRGSGDALPAPLKGRKLSPQPSIKRCPALSGQIKFSLAWRRIARPCTPLLQEERNVAADAKIAHCSHPVGIADRRASAGLATADHLADAAQRQSWYQRREQWFA